MVNFPTSLDTGTTLPNPTTSNNTNSPSHAGLHDNENAAIIASQTKLGIGSSTPVSNTLLVGTGTGASTWQGLTSAQLLAILTDETGTGSAVFANTPVLVTPKVDTINENTTNNGVTVGGVSLKSGGATLSGALSVGGTSTLTGNVTAGGTLGTTGQLSVQTATAPPSAGASTAGIKMSSTANLGVFFGSGAPTFSAAQGSIYLRTDGSSSSTRLYVNSNGSTTWVNITSAS